MAGVLEWPDRVPVHRETQMPACVTGIDLIFVQSNPIHPSNPSNPSNPSIDPSIHPYTHNAYGGPILQQTHDVTTCYSLRVVWNYRASFFFLRGRGGGTASKRAHQRGSSVSILGGGFVVVVVVGARAIIAKWTFQEK